MRGTPQALHSQTTGDLCVPQSPQSEEMKEIKAGNEDVLLPWLTGEDLAPVESRVCQLQSRTAAETELGAVEREVTSAVRFQRPETAQRGRDEEHMVWWEEVTVVLKSKKYNEK